MARRIITVIDVDNDDEEERCVYFYDQSRGRRVIRPLSLRNGGGKRRRIGEITDDEDDNGSSNSNPGKDNNDGTEQRQCKN